jgi:probable F420-dependent oxidoreductase
MRFGVAFTHQPRGGTSSLPYTAMAVAVAEDLGFESVWAAEHVVVPTEPDSRYPGASDGAFRYPKDVAIPDPLIWLAHVSALSSTVQLGTCVLVLPHYNPVLLAKQAASLDALSAGRLQLGVGIGWCREEATAVGYSFDQRAARLEEGVAAMRALWDDEPKFTGTWTTFADVICRPRPPRGRVPILIGGQSPASARRAGTIGDGYIPAVSTPSQLARLMSDMRTAAAAHGRSPDGIEVSCRWLNHPSEQAELRASVQAFTELNVSRLIVSFSRHPDEGSLRAALTRFAEVAHP